MIPLRDDAPRRGPALMTMALIAANVAVWLYSLGLGRQAEALFNYMYGAVPAFIFGHAPQGLPLPPLATLITYQFVHGGFLHLAGNMLYLWIFGASLEQAMGRARYLAFYLLGGVISGLTQVVFSAGEMIPVIGASGSVAMVLGAYLMLFPRRNVLVLIWLLFLVQTIKVPAVIFLGLWFFFQVMGSGGGVAWMAHIGGFVAGLLLVRSFMPRPKARPGGGANFDADRRPPTLH